MSHQNGLGALMNRSNGVVAIEMSETTQIVVTGLFSGLGGALIDPDGDQMFERRRQMPLVGQGIVAESKAGQRSVRVTRQATPMSSTF